MGRLCLTCEVLGTTRLVTTRTDGGFYQGSREYDEGDTEMTRIRLCARNLQSTLAVLPTWGVELRILKIRSSPIRS